MVTGKLGLDGLNRADSQPITSASGIHGRALSGAAVVQPISLDHAKNADRYSLCRHDVLRRGAPQGISAKRDSINRLLGLVARAGIVILEADDVIFAQIFAVLHFNQH